MSRYSAAQWAESLEDRTLLANFGTFASDNGAASGNLVLDTDVAGNNETVTITKTNSTTITIAVSGAHKWQVSDTGPTGVSGDNVDTLTIDTSTFVTAGLARSITFNNTANINMTVAFAGGATAFANQFTLNFGSTGNDDVTFLTATSTFANPFSLTATGAGSLVTNTNPVVFNSTASFTSGPNAITLTNASNDFQGALSLSNSGTNAIQITDTNALPLGTVSTANTLTLTAGGSVTQSGTITANALVSTLTGSASAFSLNTQTNNITTLGAITAPGGVSLTNGNNSTTVTAAISATDNAIAIDVGTGTYTQNDFNVVAGSGAITITADTVALVDNTGDDAFQTTNVLTLKPKTANRTMSLAGTSSFDLTQTEITDLAGGVTGTGSIVIGDSAASTAVLTIGGLANFGVKKVTLNAGSITDGGNTRTIIANTLNLNARTGPIGASGNSATMIDTAVVTLGFSATGVNDVGIYEANGAIVSGTAAAGKIDLFSGGGNWTVGGNITTTGNVVLDAPAGSILQQSGTVSGNSVALLAGGVNASIGVSGTPLLTSATSLLFSGTGSGQVWITEGNGARVFGTTGSGSINLVSSTGNWTVAGAITTSGNVSLQAAGAIVESIGGTVSGNLLTLTGGAGGIGASSNPLLINGTTLVSNTSGDGNQFLSEANSVIWNTSSAGAGTIELDGGTFQVASGQDITSGTVNVASGATLGGSGTLNANVIGAGTFSPGSSPGSQTINGNFTPTGTVNFEVNSPYATAGTDFDQYIVNGGVNLSGANLTFTRNVAGTPASGWTVTLISNDNIDSTTASTSPANGTTILGGDFKIAYNAGTGGNNVVLSETFAPTVTITDDELGVANIANGDVVFTFTFSEGVTDFTVDDVTVVGGTKAATFAIGVNGDAIYTLAVTPDVLLGNMTVDVGAGVAFDVVGNPNTAATQDVQPVDTIPHTVVITDDEPGVANIASGDVLFTITFSEAMTGFTVDDVVVTGGTKAAAFSTGVGGDSVYTLQVTPAANSTGTITVDVPDGVALDANTATNTNSAAVQDAQPFDTQAPTVTITDDEPGTANIAGGTILYTFKFDEGVTNFAVDDVVVVGGTKAVAFASGMNGDTVYTLVITPNANFEGNLTVNVGAGVAVDAASNPNTAATESTQTVDTLVPTVTITDDEPGVANITNGDVVFTFTFGEGVTDFTVDDVVVTGGTKAATFATGVNGDAIYTLAVTPDVLLGNMTVDVGAGVAFDAVGNPNMAATQDVQPVDTIPHTVVITDDEPGVANIASGDVLFTITFSEAMSGFTVGEVMVAGGTKAAAFSTGVDGDSVYTLLVTPAAISTGTITVDVPDGVAVDANTGTNTNSAAVQDVQPFDTQTPTVTITDDEAGTANIAGGTILYTFTFSEGVTDFTVADVMVLGGTKAAAFVTGISGDSVYTLVITPPANFEGNLTVNVGAGVAVDAANNPNTAATESTQAVDTFAPTVTITDDEPGAVANMAGGTITYTFTFGEGVTDFTVDDVAIVGGTKATAFATGVSGDAVYTLEVTPDAHFEGNLLVNVAASVAVDAANNPNTPATQSVQAIDTLQPTVTILDPHPSATITTHSTNIDVTFSQPVVGVDATDLVLTGTAAGSASVGIPTNIVGNTWRFPVNGLTVGTLDVGLAPDADDIEDAVGNDVASLNWSYTITVAAMVDLSVSTSAGSEAGRTVITVTATADAAVIGDQTVNLAVTGTGISTGDYSLTDDDAAADIQIKILNGQTTGTVTFTVVDDLQAEGDETATLTMSSPSAGLTLGTTTTQDITINDDDIAYSIGTSAATVNESPQVVTFTVTRSGSTNDAASTVKFAITGTATNAADYNNIGGTSGVITTTGTISFAIGETSKTITLNIVDDNLVELSETILVTLSNGTAPGTATISPASATTTITDNEPPPATLDAGGGLTFQDASGNRTDRLTVTYDVVTNSLIFNDPFNPLPAGVGTVINGNTIRVPLSALTTPTLTFNLGGGDDKLDIRTVPTTLAILVTGGDGNDTVYANNGGDTINTGNGNDSVNGGTGNDVVDGGIGNDTVFGGAGTDRITGGDGADYLSGDAGNDTIFGGNNNDTLLGGDGDDTITGDAGTDSINGGNGNDTLDGGSEDDTIRGSSGNDAILGGTGNDQLFGENDNDTISGGAGNDSILGGAGNDVLAGEAGADTVMGESGQDTIAGGSGSGKDVGDVVTDLPADLRETLKLVFSNGAFIVTL